MDTVLASLEYARVSAIGAHEISPERAAEQAIQTVERIKAAGVALATAVAALSHHPQADSVKAQLVAATDALEAMGLDVGSLRGGPTSAASSSNSTPTAIPR